MPKRDKKMKYKKNIKTESPQQSNKELAEEYDSGNLLHAYCKTIALNPNTMLEIKKERLRTFLTVVRGNTELLIHQDRSKSARDKMLTDIHLATLEMIKILQTL